MKITANYGNTANIPDGIQYGGMKPFYNLSVELDVDVKTVDVKMSEERQKIYQGMLMELKDVIDPMILKDMKAFKHCRYKCSCTPVYLDGKLVHSETCLMGTGDGTR